MHRDQATAGPEKTCLNLWNFSSTLFSGFQFLPPLHSTPFLSKAHHGPRSRIRIDKTCDQEHDKECCVPASSSTQQRSYWSPTAGEGHTKPSRSRSNATRSRKHPRRPGRAQGTPRTRSGQARERAVAALATNAT